MAKKKLKIVKKNRNEIAVDKFRREQKEKEYGNKLLIAGKKMDYLKNLMNGRYYLERCNIIASQLISFAEEFEKLNEEEKNNPEKIREIELKTIQEYLDGRTKTKPYLHSEYALMKLHAIEGFRNSFFAKKQLIEELKVTEEELQKYEEDYYNGKIIREEYEERKPKSKAEFVNS